MKRQHLLLGLLTMAALSARAQAPAEYDELSEVVVSVPEPRFVAPTTRDRIGRVWVPVTVDGKGPFRLVLDTGAQRSALTHETAALLGAALDRSPPVMVHGVTGKAVSPTVAVDLIQVGDLQLQPALMPVVANVFGGAEGLLGTEGMQDHRIFMDFRHDIITISRSRNLGAPDGFTTVRFLADPLKLLIVRAQVGNRSVRAIIDTGAQATVGNLALQSALRKRLAHEGAAYVDRVEGATGQWQSGIASSAPIRIGELMVHNAHVTFADLHIFQQWGLEDEPALVIGMDIIGLLDQLVIDYRRHELQIKARRG
jgi:predicted aspartyl protease